MGIVGHFKKMTLVQLYRAYRAHREKEKRGIRRWALQQILIGKLKNEPGTLQAVEDVFFPPSDGEKKRRIEADIEEFEDVKRMFYGNDS